MIVLGIETSCDECSAAVVEDGKIILSNVIMTQIPFHAQWSGVVPEIASRKHTEWIYTVTKEALDKAGMKVKDIDAVAVTNRPGLFGSLLVGLSFAKAFAWSNNVPFIAVDHMLAHLYAPRLLEGKTGESISQAPAYPFLGLLVSGGHTIICRADNFDDITVLGTTIDDAIGEAFDKVAKYYGFGYPGGAVIDKMACNGDSGAFRFPIPSLHKGDHRYDVSYSGLKNAAINQLDIFKIKDNFKKEDIAASFQKAAVETLLRALFNAIDDSKLNVMVAGGGVAANSYLRARLSMYTNLECIFPPLDLCGDNAAMVAGVGYHYLLRGERSPLNIAASARVAGFKKRYP
jgi:N6-L-threonylcarbamoyladenine synthase